MKKCNNTSCKLKDNCKRSKEQGETVFFIVNKNGTCDSQIKIKK